MFFRQISAFPNLSLCRYPAKFIPQIPAYVIQNYAPSGAVLYDPFAGSGTVGLVARVYGYDYILSDLNPLLLVCHRTLLCKPLSEKQLEELFQELVQSQLFFVPEFKNLYYWIPEPFFEVLSPLWGYAHQSNLKYFLYIPLMKLTKYFSYADEKMHKLHTSKWSKEKVNNLLNSVNLKSLIYEKLKKELIVHNQKLMHYQSLGPKEVNFQVYAGLNVLYFKPHADFLITSPPYLQAQEYIRSTKLELFFLGFSEEYVRKLSKKEIPYAEVEKTKIFSETYHSFLKIFDGKDKTLYENYFHAIIKTLSCDVPYMAILVGNARIKGIEVPIDRILIEHFGALGYKLIKVYKDEIVKRYMFRTVKNPATGREEERIKEEKLIILKA